MKYIYLTILSLLFISCGQDDSSSKSNQKKEIITTDNTKAAFSIPFFKDEDSPLKNIQYLEDK